MSCSCEFCEYTVLMDTLKKPVEVLKEGLDESTSLAAILAPWTRCSVYRVVSADGSKHTRITWQREQNDKLLVITFLYIIK